MTQEYIKYMLFQNDTINYFRILVITLVSITMINSVTMVDPVLIMVSATTAQIVQIVVIDRIW